MPPLYDSQLLTLRQVGSTTITLGARGCRLEHVLRAGGTAPPTRNTNTMSIDSPAGWQTGQARGDTPPRAFVVILGWFSAQDKHLKKYSDLLEAAGFDTGRCIAPTSVVSGTRASQHSYAVTVLGAMLADSTPTLPIAFYIFSNGGAFVYRAMLPLLVSEPTFADGVQPRVEPRGFAAGRCLGLGGVGRGLG